MRAIAVVITLLISTVATPTYAAWPWDDPCAPQAWNAPLSQNPDPFGLYLQVLGDGCPTTPTKTVMCYIARNRGLAIEADDDIGNYQRGAAQCRLLGY